jgi:hypothetical protein
MLTAMMAMAAMADRRRYVRDLSGECTWVWNAMGVHVGIFGAPCVTPQTAHITVKHSAAPPSVRYQQSVPSSRAGCPCQREEPQFACGCVRPLSGGGSAHRARQGRPTARPGRYREGFEARARLSQGAWRYAASAC